MFWTRHLGGLSDGATDLQSNSSRRKEIIWVIGDVGSENAALLLVSVLCIPDRVKGRRDVDPYFGPNCAKSPRDWTHKIRRFRILPLF